MADPSPAGGPGPALVPSADMRLLFGPLPTYRLHVWSWLKGPAQKLIFSEWLAITIGHDIFAWRGLDDAELAHELVHVRQWNANGIAYIWRYREASQAALKAGKDRYWGNAFEEEAYATADKIRAGVKVIPVDVPPPAAGPGVVAAEAQAPAPVDQTPA